MRPIIIILLVPCLLLSTVLIRQCGGTTAPATAPPQPLIPGLLTFLDQRLALVYPIIQAFKATITSDPKGITRSWSGRDICNHYRGFICDHPPDNVSATAVAGIDFNGFQLAAPTLVGFIDKLPDLAIFHANTNSFAGVLPTLSTLPYLYELDLSNNLFTGVFPLQLVGSTTLTFLDLRYNLFTGVIPPRLSLPNLDDALFLNNNLFTAVLPLDLGATPAAYLTFANNKLTGTIPGSIGNLSETLLEVLFLNNLITGCIPYEIGFLKNATVFDASNNILIGQLPSSLACMARVQVLKFAGNNLSGTVPEAACLSLGQRKDFYVFDLSDNFLTGVGTECKKLVDRGVLKVGRNCIRGFKDQKSLVECLLNVPILTCRDRSTLPCTLPGSAKPSGSAPGNLPPRRGTRALEARRRRLVTYAALERTNVHDST